MHSKMAVPLLNQPERRVAGQCSGLNASAWTLGKIVHHWSSSKARQRFSNKFGAFSARAQNGGRKIGERMPGIGKISFDHGRIDRACNLIMAAPPGSPCSFDKLLP